jgi:hypothetical protein
MSPTGPSVPRTIDAKTYEMLALMSGKAERCAPS